MGTHYRVQTIPAFIDNYIWLIVDINSDQCVVVDPGDAAPVLSYLTKHQLTLTAILITHHHRDHVGGVGELLKQSQFPIPVYGPEKEATDVVTHPLKGGDCVNLFSSTTFHIIDVPGHTLGHIAFVDDASLFCGDTLFAGGCGRMFEGSAEQFQHSLTTLAKLPKTTNVYCAHEYTLANLNFALTVEPQNLALLARIDYCRQQRVCKKSTIPSTIEQELSSNPFLRVDQASVQHAIAENIEQPPVTDVIENFALLRSWKDTF